MSRQLQHPTLTVEWLGLRRDLREGRRWRVGPYVVSFFVHGGLRFGRCTCLWATFNESREGAKPCKHILAAAHPDSILTQTPMRGH